MSDDTFPFGEMIIYTRSQIYSPPRDREKIDHKSENDNISEDHISENLFFNDHIIENPCPLFHVILEAFPFPTAGVSKKISLLQAMQLWRDAWDSISKESIKNCWKKAQLVEYEGLASEFVDD